MGAGGVRRGGGGADLFDRGLTPVLAHALPDETRVAARLGVKRGGVRIGGSGKRGEALDVADAQRAEAEEMVRGVLRERSERRRRRIVIDVRADDGEVHLSQLTGKEVEQQQRRVVGQVQVVEDQQHGVRGRRRAQRGGNVHEQPESRALRLR